MQRLIFESSPAFIFLCLFLGLGYAFLLYKSKHPWSKRINQLLFGLRALTVALLSFLMIGPIVKLTNNIFEKPEIVLLVDNSTSLKETVDSVKFQTELNETRKQLKDQGYEVSIQTLTGNNIEKIKFDSRTSDLNSALKNTIADYEGKNLAGIVLLTDGIYNSGSSPLYTPWRVPVQTVGLGDTIEHADLVLKNVAYNKVAYQGNQFPLRAEVLIKRLPNQDVTVSVRQNGALINQQKKNTGNKSLLEFDFLADAKEKGIQRLDVSVQLVPAEMNIKNNSASIFVEVVEGRKKILVIAPAPHPDLKALRSVVEKNPNYEFILHIPGVSKTDPALLQPGQAELVVFDQPFDQEIKTSALFSQLSKGKSSILLLIGNKTNLRQLVPNGVPLNFENPYQKDEATAVVSANFHDFDLLENSSAILSRYPPIKVPFGKFSYPQNAQVILNQRIGSVPTDRPMLLSWDENNHKVAAFIGEGLWQWRLSEFSSTEKSEVFDDVFLKLVQYLSTLDDKRKFRFFPIQNEFTDAAPAVFEGQVYNDLFEKVYGNKIDLTLRSELGGATNYSYLLSPGGERYQIGGLKEGSYSYTASTLINSKKESVSGQFLVTAQNIESQNLVADFGLMRKLSLSTGGRFYRSNELQKFIAYNKKIEAKSLIHSEESLDPFIHLKWFFFLLLALISTEWFIRKYSGSY